MTSVFFEPAWTGAQAPDLAVHVTPGKHMVSVNRLSIEQQARVAACLVEGNSIRGTVRLTGAAKNTVSKLLLDLGAACADLLDRELRDLPLRRVQLDEMWGFVAMKQKTATAQGREDDPDVGSVWLWVAICADTRLVTSFFLGDRGADSAQAFVGDLRLRVSGRPQVTTDGHKPYLAAVEKAFGADVDYAMLDKQYETRADGSDGRYKGAEHLVIKGAPDERHVSTARVERQNLTVRMGMCRYIRQTNGAGPSSEVGPCSGESRPVHDPRDRNERHQDTVEHSPTPGATWRVPQPSRRLAVELPVLLADYIPDKVRFR